MSNYIFLLLAIFLACKGDLCKSDQCVTILDVTNTTLKLKIINRSRFGFSTVTISTNDTLLNSYSFISYVDNLNMVLYSLENKGNLTFINPSIYTDTLVIQYQSLFQYPVGNYMSFFGQEIIFNKTLLTQRLGYTDSLFIRLRMNVYRNPTSPTSFSSYVDEDYTFFINGTSGDIPNPIMFDLTKLTVIHPSWFAFNLFSLTVIGILLLIFSQYQPLYSRGFVPFIALICQFSMELSNFWILLPLEVLQTNAVQIIGLYFFIILYLGGLTCLTFIVLLLLFRYVLLQYLNKRKLLFENDQKVVRMKWYWRLLKLMGNPWVTLLITIPFFIIICILFSLAGYAGDNKYFIFYTITVFMAASTVNIAFLADFILNSRKGVPFYEMLIGYLKDDVFFFRTEVVFWGLVVEFPIFVTKTVFQYAGIEFWYLLGNTIMIFTILCHTVLSPLILTIIELVRRLTSKTKNSVGELSNLLDEPSGLALIKEYAKNEYSSENIICFEKIQKFKQLKTEEEMINFLADFYLLFLNGGESELELNVTKDASKIVEDLLKKKEGINTKSLEEVERQIKYNITDTFQRYRMTAEYRRYLKEKTVFKKY